jgi:hypothetical protein
VRTRSLCRWVPPQVRIRFILPQASSDHPLTASISAYSRETRLIDVSFTFSTYAKPHGLNSYYKYQPYNAPELRVRRPGREDELVYKYSDDDPFFSEASNFIDVVEQKNYASEEVNILSSYEGVLLSRFLQCFFLQKQGGKTCHFPG